MGVLLNFFCKEEKLPSPGLEPDVPPTKVSSSLLDGMARRITRYDLSQLFVHKFVKLIFKILIFEIFQVVIGFLLPFARGLIVDVIVKANDAPSLWLRVRDE